MNEGLGVFFDQFGNPISSLIGGVGTPPTVPEGPGGPDLVGIGGAILSDQINSELGLNLVSPDEGSRFIEEGILGGNPGVVRDIVVDKVNNAPSSVKANIAGRVLGLAEPAFATQAAVNSANKALQVSGDVIQTGLQFGQEGIGALSDRIDDSRFDIFGIPSGALNLTEGALGLTDRGIERLQGEGQRFTGQVNVLGGVIYDQLGRPIGLVNQLVDRGASRIGDFFNLFRRDDDDRRDDDPGPGIVINQADDDRRDDDPPVPTTVTGVSGPAGMVVDPGAVSSSFGGRGGADRGGDVVIGNVEPMRRSDKFGAGIKKGGRAGGTTGTTPGPAGMGFTPPAPRRRFPMGRAEGGLATIPRYLKGR